MESSWWLLLLGGGSSKEYFSIFLFFPTILSKSKTNKTILIWQKQWALESRDGRTQEWFVFLYEMGSERNSRIRKSCRHVHPRNLTNWCQKWSEMAIFNRSHLFQGPSFWVSMLVFGGVSWFHPFYSGSKFVPAACAENIHIWTCSRSVRITVNIYIYIYICFIYREISYHTISHHITIIYTCTTLYSDRLHINTFWYDSAILAVWKVLDTAILRLVAG